MHEALTPFATDSDDFCWPVRTLGERVRTGRYRPRRPAMAAGLTDHVRSLPEGLAFPACQPK